MVFVLREKSDLFGVCELVRRMIWFEGILQDFGFLRAPAQI
jgi:hypothetical protein